MWVVECPESTLDPIALGRESPSSMIDTTFHADHRYSATPAVLYEQDELRAVSVRS